MLPSSKSRSRTRTLLRMRRMRNPQACQAQCLLQRMMCWIFRGKLATSPSIVCLKIRNFTTFPVDLNAVYYFNCVGLPLLVMFSICNMTYTATMTITPSILRAWSESGGPHMWFYTGMYTLSSVLAFAATGSVIWKVLPHHSNGYNSSCFYQGNLDPHRS